MAGDYSVRVKAVLDVGSIKAQLDALSKSGLNIDASKATKELENVQKQAGLVGDSVTKATKKGSDGFKGLKGYISKGVSSFGDITKKVMLFGAATNIINGVSQSAKAMVGSVFELDASLTELKKVSDLSGSSLDQFTDKAYDLGAEVARTGTEVIDASTEFVKMGYTVNESLDLSRVATMFQNVADTEISAGDAANFINSQMKAFNFTAAESEHIIDAVNQVANEFAVGTNDLSGALTVAGSSLATTGNSFEQTIGLITSATEMMPGKAQTVGNSFRTIGINIAAMADSTDTWVAANGRVNVALKDSQGNLRSTYDIMKDLYTGVEGQSVAWNELSEAEQNAIAVQAGGKTRYQAFVASMSNFDAAIRSTETAMNSQGSAARENANAIDSLEGHINALKSAFQKFATSLISSDLVKNIIDVGTAILNFASSDIGQAVIKLGLLATAIGVAARAFNKLHAIVKGMSFLEGLKTLWLGTSKATDKDTAATDRNTAAKNRNTAAQEANRSARTKNTAATTAQTAATNKANQSMSMLPDTTSKSAKGFDKLNDSTKKSTSTMGKFKSGLSKVVGSAKEGTGLVGKLSGVFTSLAPTLTVTGLAATGVAIGITKYYDGLEQAASDAVTKYEETEQQIAANKQEIERLTSKTEGLTDAEADRLAILISQTGELEKQLDKQAQQVVDTYMETGGKDPYLKDLKASGWVKGMKNDLEDYQRTYNSFLSANTKADEKAAKKSLDYYKDSMDKRAEAAQGFLDALKTKEDLGLDLTEEEKKYKKFAESALDTYDEMKSAADPEALKAMFPDADFADMSQKELAKYTDKMREFTKAMGDGEEGAKAFKNLMEGLDDGFSNLGSFNEDTGKFDFSNTNIEDYANALGVSVDYAEQLLTAQTKNGNINWDVPEEEIDSFNQGLSGLNTTLTDTDGKMLTSKTTLEEYAKSLGIPEAAIPSFISAYTEAGNTLVDFTSDAGTTIDQLGKLGEASGLAYDEMGNLTGVNLDQLAQSVYDLGGSSEDLEGLINYLRDIEGVTFDGEWEDYITGADTAEQAAKELFDAVDKVPEEKDIKLSVEDNAIGVMLYAQAVADGYEGTYEAWLTQGGGEEAIAKFKEAQSAGEDYEQTYSGTVDANNQPAIGAIAIANAAGLNWRQKKFNANVNAKDNATGTINRLKRTYAGQVIATATIAIKAAASKRAKGKRKGEEGGLAWVGDEGSRSNPKPELIQTRYGAYLAGTKGWEQVVLADDDIVYSNTETRRLLGNNYTDSGFTPRYASGTPKFLDANSDNESIKKKIDAWSDSLDTWKHNLDTGRVTEEQYINWLKSQYKLSNKMTQDQYRDAEKTIFDYYAAIEEAALQNYITELEYGNESLDSMLDRINKAYKAQKINDEQVKDLREDAYKAFMEYNLKMLENEEATYGDVLKVIEDFYKQGKISADDYYGYLEDASNAAKDAETERLEKLQEEQENQQELAKLYAQLQVDNIDKQIEALEKQNEAQEEANELAELYNNLAKARQQKVKVFRNGQWVYEEDRDAIKEAQDAINDFNAEHATDELEKLKEEWQAILDMFDDQETLAEIKDLENALGKTAEELFGFMGTDLSAWTEWFKNTLATGMGIEDILTELEGLEGFEKISEYLDSEGHVDWNAIEQAIKNNRFASGTLNAPGGLSIVGEKGWELGALNKGDAIFPHDISENLMRWGAITPSDFKAKDTESIVQSFNFDKLVLPNVRNADDFVAELKKLPNLAIQRANGRY